MKQNNFYRRNFSNTKMNGFRERLAWQLSKRPMTGTELCEILGLELSVFNKRISSALRGTGVVHLTASEWFPVDDGLNDRLYTLESMGSRAFPKPKKSIHISKNSYGRANDETREANIKAARARAKLIKNGTYRDHMG